MTISVETGTGSATAESFISVTDADTYHSDRGATSWAALTTAQKEQNLRKATEFMTGQYRQRWKGVRMTSTQALDWPRAYVYLEPVVTGANQEFPNLVADDIVPVEVKRACAELALKSYSAELLADTERATVREKVDVIEVEYDKYATQEKKYTAIEYMLRPYFNESTSGFVHKVVR